MTEVSNPDKLQFYYTNYYEDNLVRCKTLLEMTNNVAGRMLAIKIRCESLMLTNQIYAVHEYNGNKFECMFCQSPTEPETIEHLFHDCSLYKIARAEYNHSTRNLSTIKLQTMTRQEQIITALKSYSNKAQNDLWEATIKFLQSIFIARLNVLKDKGFWIYFKTQDEL